MDNKKQEVKKPASTVTTTVSADLKIEKTKGEPDKLKQLMKPVPEEFIETYNEDGMEFRGYKAQYAIDLLNETFGLGNWYAQFKLEEKENINRAWLAYGTVEIYLYKPKKENSFDEDIFLADGIGGAYARRIENALKGAKTSAFKNACRYLGIGSELYLAGHDEDIIAKEEEPAQKEEKEVPNEAKDMIDKINKAETVQDLESFLPEISKVEGKAVKDLLIQQYNLKKVALMDKK